MTGEGALIRVLIADDHTVLRHGLRLILNEADDLRIVGEASDGEQAVALALELEPDVVLMDVNMPGVDGIEATRRIRAARPETYILVLTVSDRDKDLVEAMRAGARGYLLKKAESGEVLEAIRRVAAGEAILSTTALARVLDELASPASSPEKLTARETEVLGLIAQGLGNKEIALALHISENTVKTHVRHILEKLNLRSRTEAATYAVRSGLAQKG
jgi:DNA-binding NarL/FixJ family response regulator